MNDNRTIEDCLCIIKKILHDEQEKIYLELSQQIINCTFIDSAETTIKSKHGHSKKNDYQLYLWIDIKINSSSYWITLFFNDVDKAHGNFHTQIGRIQFWKNIHYPRGSIGTPHVKGSCKKWLFISENSYDPQLKIGNADYSPQLVVEKFLQFIQGNNS